MELDPKTKLQLIQTLRSGSCKHFNRVNICDECRKTLEKIVSGIPGIAEAHHSNL